MSELYGISLATSESEDPCPSTSYGCAKVALSVLLSGNKNAQKRLSKKADEIFSRVPPIRTIINLPVRVRVENIPYGELTIGRKISLQVKKIGVRSPQVRVVESQRPPIKPGLRLGMLLWHFNRSYQGGTILERARIIAKLERLTDSIDRNDSNDIARIMGEEVGSFVSPFINHPAATISAGMGVAALAGVALFGVSRRT